MEFFDTHDRRVKWNGEPVGVRVSGYAIIERDMPPAYHELLFVRTKQSPFLELPGGGLEPGTETLQDAVLRECLEEIQCAVSLESQIFFQEDRGFHHVSDRMNGFYHACNHWYLATTRQEPSVPPKSNEITEIVWMDVIALLPSIESVHPVHRAAVRALVAARYDANAERLHALGRQLLLPVR